MKNEKTEKNTVKESAKKDSFKRPELKKHGKLKSTATGAVQTYYYIV
jgi:hypothetical protein